MYIPVDFAQVNIYLGGQALPRGAQLVFGVDNSVGALSAIAMCNEIKVKFAAEILPDWTDLGTVTRIKCKLGPPATGPEADIFPNLPGGDSYEPTPPQVAMLVNKVTSLGGRQNRGRMFFPCINEAGVGSSGVIGDATLALWSTNFINFHNALVTDDLSMYVLHNDVDTAPTLVSALEPAGLVATQRRRLRRVGGRKKRPV